MVFSKDILAEIPKDGSEEKDILIEITNDGIDQFCEVLKADWPLSIHASYFIKTMSEWRIKKSSIKCQLLCVNPNDNLGSFVGILESDTGKIFIILYTLEESCAQLEKALIETNKIKWDSSPTFEAVLLKHAGAIERAIQSKGKHSELYCDSTLYFMNNDTATNININVPNDVTVSELNIHDIDYMYSVWAHNDIYSKEELLDAVNFNCGVGVYNKQDGRLLSWMVHTHYGGLGNLQTRKGEEGKGYGKLIVRYLAHKLSSTKIDMHVTIKDDNARSRHLFSSIGFEFKSPLKFYIVK